MLEFSLSLFILAIINAIAIIGLYRAMTLELKRDYSKKSKYVSYQHQTIDEENSGVLGPFHFWLLRKLGNKWVKPFAACPACMASVHSTYFFWPFAVIFIPAAMWWVYVLYIPLVSGVVTIVMSEIE